MKKGEIYEGIIEKVEYPNRGKVFVDGHPVIVKNGIPGQKIRFVINKKRSGRAEGRILEVLEKSPLEMRDPVCSIFPACGGCMYQTMPYEEQLKMKEQQIRELMDKAVRGNYVFEGIHGSPVEFAYRNKMEFSFGDAWKDGPLTLGLHKKGSTYDVLTASDCKLVHEDMTRILCCVLEYFQKLGATYYRKMQHTGYLRHLLLRRGTGTGEILVHLITTTQAEYDLEPLKEALLALPLEGEIVGIMHILNDSLADVVQSDETRILYGRDYFYEELLGLKFKISTFSFFQPNSRGAEVLYSLVRDYIGDTRDQVVFDLYSGTGTIAQLLAEVAREVIGVEIVEEAVEAARANARLNGLDNCRFIAGDVLKVLDEIPQKPDVIVLDPPRDGCHPRALPKILKYGVDKIIYISCKATSLARDLEMIQEYGYQVERCTCVDQFCETVHVETVCLLGKRKPDTTVKIGIDMEDYRRIRDKEKAE
ncbi:MAG TPA: 23S rRNA (uracil(1939)-C(5))-methyltransferase RlmD [Candidatus Blautia gallistercoris]|uniref:23S rRNA (Uracil(1939)-C(5))-methyltransferase RlmD n=1 Tax=Candidatus Blautia gallistercoris TaxID=2838490 RepID=A0A9D2B3S5_9FIRM|nr:23S rRNA (uracil(1939)-C(5))-methyltransferase RlmD [Candidatus Blautia gallistercoris]